MKQPVVIASIVVYRHDAQALSATLSSLLSQSCIRKVVLVDNGQGCWARQLDDSRIEYLKSPGNVGYGRGHNLAIQRYAAECDFFLICNPDIAFDAGALDTMVQAAQQHPAGLFMPKVVYPDGSNQELCKLLPSPVDLFARRFMPWLARWTDQRYLLPQANSNAPFAPPSLSGCFMLCKADALLALGGFDERYFMYMEDVDLSRRFASRYGCCYLPVATVVHAYQKDSYRKSTLLRAHLVSAVRYFNKWGWFFDAERVRLNRACLQRLPPRQRLHKR